MSSYPSRHNMRLADYNYSQAGAYFITVCVEERLCLFGSIEGEDMRLNPAGQMIYDVWQNLPQHYDGIDIDLFVVMPITSTG